MRKKLALSVVALCVATGAAGASEKGAVEQFADDSVFVASPAEIMRLRQKLQDQSAATRAPVGGEYHPDIPSDILDIDATFDLAMEPGEAAPRIYIARYQSTAIQFIDAHGRHWPIRKITSWLDGLVGIERAIDGLTPMARMDEDGEDVDVVESARAELDPRDPQTGSFTVTALRHGAVGNITIYLQGLSQPVTLMLVGKPGLFHREATIRIGSTGPNSSYAEMFERGVAAGAANNPDLTNALHGVTPAGSERLGLEGGSGKAWVKGEHIYLQTDLAVFSPKIIQSTHSAGRYRAYKLPKTTRVMGTDPAGRTVSIRLTRSAAASYPKD